MPIPSLIRYALAPLVMLVVAAIAYFTQERWLPLVNPGNVAEEESEVVAPVDDPKVLKLSPQARKNLGLVVKPARPQTYWRTIQIPGILANRPGETDRGVTAPAVGVVTEIHAYPGQTVRPGESLFRLRLSSEYLQSAQKELFTATKERQIVREQLDRLRPLATSGAVPGARIIELESQELRQEALIQSYRQDLLICGLTPQQVDEVAAGEFIREINIAAPPVRSASGSITGSAVEPGEASDEQDQAAYEVQQLQVSLGQQVQAGDLLATLSNHRRLYIQGHAFKREAPYLEDAAQNRWKVTVEFAEDSPEHWPDLSQEFEIEYLSNAVDAESRTFDFYIPLTNQPRLYEKNGETFVVWRFRPGQRVRLHVPVEELHDVLVLPSAAVVRDGPDAYVFQQNGDLFNRIPVQVLQEDRLNVILADDGSVTPGLYLAQNGAASLNRVLKAQAASGVRADVHVHADGTVHAAH
ncbi:efflux RND transporter periplasmic adaptor subunit [Blastopirellula sp. JC732]|uniref:Efflux RND transporter periplasmic adaptor subunit n=1 Tax=Blastopirellula sediminis TaxID=2894196 RepID=A0A9X1MM63_9BACT|nr:HlyD family efflux transporter periplasmic adaptor subunit [Blastopirellula sediminis]MCC9608776.1 efflux RND transporter periplasmic adaptor subunit [Blastopirellula sediminis]MCC9628447.1 efflux RND transporter periplasmic adaptor subunit [Blastopirellula sediminis]